MKMRASQAGIFTYSFVLLASWRSNPDVGTALSLCTKRGETVRDSPSGDL